MQNVGIMRRLIGYLFDFAVCITLMVPVLIWFVRGLFGDQSGSFLLGWSLVVMLLWLMLRIIYLSIGWFLPGGTAGCRVLHMSITGRSGIQWSFPRSLLRSLSYVLIPIGWLPLLWSENNTTLFDLVSGSQVISSDE
jgi:uncharacterized RDD family membrane protein YckC